MSIEKEKDEFGAAREIAEILKSFSEEDRKRAMRWACEKLGIEENTINTGSRPLLTSKEVTNGSGKITHDKVSGSTVKNIKTFVEEKNPKTDIHFTAVVAYYYQFECLESERKESITPTDLKTATRLVNRERLKHPDITLANAMNAGLLDKISHGHYAINSVGENLVAMILPDITNGKKSVPHTRKPIKKIGKKSKKTFGKK